MNSSKTSIANTWSFLVFSALCPVIFFTWLIIIICSSIRYHIVHYDYIEYYVTNKVTNKVSVSDYKNSKVSVSDYKNSSSCFNTWNNNYYYCILV